MEGLQKVLIWLLMVLLFLALLLGGVFGYFYYTAQPGEEANAPLAVTGAGGQAAEVLPYSYALQTPVMGGVMYRGFSGSGGVLGGPVACSSLQPVQLGLPAGCQIERVQIETGGKVAFAGTGEEYAAFSYPGNGQYLYRVQLQLPAQDPDQRPHTVGQLLYEFSVQVQVEMQARLSADRVEQGEAIAVRLENELDGVQPVGESGLGPVNFLRDGQDSWVAFVPVAYNREAGEYTIELRCGDFTASLPVTVLYKPYEKRNFETADQLPDAGPQTAAAENQYRNTIWPLYDTAGGQKLWQGPFIQPVEGRVLYGYGMGSLLPGDTVSRRHSGVDYLVSAPDTPVNAPAAGQVAFSGQLELTGNTVVIEHGGGVKSYFYHLGSLAVASGQMVEQGQRLGGQGPEQALHYEIRIGNQSIDPNPVLSGRSGLYG